MHNRFEGFFFLHSLIYIFILFWPRWGFLVLFARCIIDLRATEYWMFEPCKWYTGKHKWRKSILAFFELILKCENKVTLWYVRLSSEFITMMRCNHHFCVRFLCCPLFSIMFRYLLPLCTTVYLKIDNCRKILFVS